MELDPNEAADDPTGLGRLGSALRAVDSMDGLARVDGHLCLNPYA